MATCDLHKVVIFDKKLATCESVATCSMAPSQVGSVWGASINGYHWITTPKKTCLAKCRNWRKADEGNVPFLVDLVLDWIFCCFLGSWVLVDFKNREEKWRASNAQLLTAPSVPPPKGSRIATCTFAIIHFWWPFSLLFSDWDSAPIPLFYPLLFARHTVHSPHATRYICDYSAQVSSVKQQQCLVLYRD